MNQFKRYLKGNNELLRLLETKLEKLEEQIEIVSLKRPDLLPALKTDYEQTKAEIQYTKERRKIIVKMVNLEGLIQ